MLLSNAIAFAERTSVASTPVLFSPMTIHLHRLLGFHDAPAKNVVENQLDVLGKMCKRRAIQWEVIKNFASEGFDIPESLLDHGEEIQFMSKRTWERFIWAHRKTLRDLRELKAKAENDAEDAEPETV